MLPSSASTLNQRCVGSNQRSTTARTASRRSPRRRKRLLIRRDSRRSTLRESPCRKDPALALLRHERARACAPRQITERLHPAWLRPFGGHGDWPLSTLTRRPRCSTAAVENDGSCHLNSVQSAAS